MRRDLEKRLNRLGFIDGRVCSVRLNKLHAEENHADSNRSPLEVFFHPEKPPDKVNKAPPIR
jgi:hypothetical protein